MSEFMTEGDQSWTRGAATWVPDMADEAAAAEPDTWTSPVPLVLTVDGETAIQADDPDAPVPYSLTPRGVEATGPDSRAVITFIERPPLSYLASLAAEQAERAPEAGS